MEIRGKRFFGRATILWIATLAVVTVTSAATATVRASVFDRDAPKIEIYPRYPVSFSPVPGGGPLVNDPGRASVAVVIYSRMCPAILPNGFVGDNVRVTASDSRFDISGVRFGYQPFCTMTAEGPVIYSVSLGDLGPGTYQTVVAGRLGDGPSGTTPTMITTLTREFVVLNLEQAGMVAIENPAPGSTQSGIGLISGWACISDSVEVSIDGGERIAVSGNMARADVRSTCGHSTAGFGLLINFNLLKPGAHTIRTYVKGTSVGAPLQFNVVAPAGEFATGLKREVTIADFPSFGKTATIDWRESEQNFGIKEVR